MNKHGFIDRDRETVLLDLLDSSLYSFHIYIVMWYGYKMTTTYTCNSSGTTCTCILIAVNVPYHTVANDLCQHVRSTHIHVLYLVDMYCKYVLVHYTHHCTHSSTTHTHTTSSWCVLNPYNGSHKVYYEGFGVYRCQAYFYIMWSLYMHPYVCYNARMYVHICWKGGNREGFGETLLTGMGASEVISVI